MISDTNAQVILGSVYHNDRDRRRSQERVVEQVSDAFQHAGIAVVEIDAYHQPSFPSSHGSPFPSLTALRHSWKQDIFNLQEARRRRGDSSRLPMRKKLRALRRVLGLAVRVREHSGVLLRRNIEGALSEKHLHVWRVLANSDAFGAVVLEDDVVLPDPEGASELTSLVTKYAERADFMDLAGGYSRSELGIDGPPQNDLMLDYMLANTTAGYFIGKRAAVALTDFLYFQPEAKHLGADFIVGILNETGFRGTTVLPASLPLRHGSMSGDFEGLIPY